MLLLLLLLDLFSRHARRYLKFRLFPLSSSPRVEVDFSAAFTFLQCNAQDEALALREFHFLRVPHASSFASKKALRYYAGKLK